MNGKEISGNEGNVRKHIKTRENFRVSLEGDVFLLSNDLEENSLSFGRALLLFFVFHEEQYTHPAVSEDLEK